MAKYVKGFFVLFCLFTSPVLAEQSLRISAIEHSDNADISEIVLRKAYKKIGIDLFITPLPAKRSLHHANDGLSDGELFRIDGMEKTHKNLVKVPVPVNQLDAMVLTRKANFVVAGWKSLKPYRIAMRRGVKFSEIGTRNMTRIAFDSNIGLGRVLLLENKIDIAVMARTNALQIIQHLQKVGATNELRLLEPIIESYPLYHYLHKKHKALVPKLTKALQDMQDSQEIQKIRAGYFKAKYAQ